MRRLPVGSLAVLGAVRSPTSSTTFGGRLSAARADPGRETNGACHFQAHRSIIAGCAHHSVAVRVNDHSSCTCTVRLSAEVIPPQQTRQIGEVWNPGTIVTRCEDDGPGKVVPAADVGVGFLFAVGVIGHGDETPVVPRGHGVRFTAGVEFGCGDSVDIEREYVQLVGEDEVGVMSNRPVLLGVLFGGRPCGLGGVGG